MSNQPLQPQPQPQTDPVRRPVPTEKLALPRQVKRLKPPTKGRRGQKENGRPGQNWQTILWREWATATDEEYARRLFDRVGQTLLDWKSALVVALGGAFYGLLAGILAGLVLVNWNIFTNFAIPTLAVWWGLGGGVAGFALSQKLSWRMWLNALTFNLFEHKLSGLTPFIIAWLAAFITKLTGLNVGSFNDLFPTVCQKSVETCQRLYLYEPIGLSLVVGVAAGMLVQGLPQRWSAGDSLTDEAKISGLNHVIIMAAVSIVGAMLGSVFLSGGGPSVVIGLLIGLGLAFTWSGGLAGLALSGLGALVSLALGSSQGVVGWLSFGAGFGLGMIPNLLGSINFNQAYKNRAWYFWWREPPPAYKIELALQLAQQTQPQPTWEEPLRRLAQENELPTPPTVLVDHLQSQDWINRFVARHAIVTIGGQAAETLKTVAIDRNHPLWETALWLLACIERETSVRYAWRAPYLLCPHCLARFDRREVELWLGVSFTYYGCRLCGQSRKFLDCPAGVTAVLDTTWNEPLSYHDGLLRVNYLARPVLFDFDRVEIAQADDEEVERLAMRAGNDTDPFRMSRYQQMPCRVKPEAGLSENSVRVLDRIFGRVERD